MVREFKLVNEKGQEYSLMNIKDYCLLTEPNGLGYSYSTEYERLGTTFIANLRKVEQGQINGMANFFKYGNYKSFIDFIESAEKLKFSYKIPFEQGVKEYFKDVEIQSLSKSEIQTNGLISESIVFDCLSLWYEENNITYTVENIADELRWDFDWDARFTDYENRNLVFENKGHVEAPILLEMSGYILKPCISVFVNKEKIYELKLDTTIEEGEKLMYCTKDTELLLYKVHTDGTIENLFNYLDLNNTNFFKLPKRSL